MGNLVSLAERPEGERKAIASKGGRAKAEKAAEKKRLQEIAIEMLRASAPESVAMETGAFAFAGGEPSVAECMISAMLLQALGGNVNAFKAVMELGSKGEAAENGFDFSAWGFTF
jgi:hypothetical protein